MKVSFNASLLEDESSRRRLTWVAEASLPSSLLHPSSEGDAENSRAECLKRGVGRAVPATGSDHVLWRMPSARKGEEHGEVWLKMAYAWRYGTVRITERFTLRAASSSAGPAGGEDL